MDNGAINFDATGMSGRPREPAWMEVPPEFVEIVELRSASLEYRLGYFRDERFVVFGYCPGGGEVIWKDGHGSGFGSGGWRTFLYEIGPAAARQGANVGHDDSIGSDVVLMDRARGVIYAAPRDRAEEFLARVNDVPLPRRRCLCAMLDCAACPVRACPLAGLPSATIATPACEK